MRNPRRFVLPLMGFRFWGRLVSVSSGKKSRRLLAFFTAGVLGLGLLAPEVAFSADVSDGVYRIPYVNGTEVKVLQDHLTHSPAPDRIDLKGINGIPPYRIVAAADGVIRFIVDDNTASCPTCSDDNNYVWIEHPNGEWTKYTHFITDSVRVDAGLSEGMFVTAGTFLGFEGDVGATNPANFVHLHFEVGVPDDPGDPIFPTGGFLKGENRIPFVCGIPGNIYVKDETHTAADCGVPNHYLGYTGRPIDGDDSVPVVRLTDQFGEGIFKVVKKSAVHYNPADKNEEGIANEEIHQVGYRVLRTGGADSPHTVDVTNQFGTITVTTANAERLLVPSTKQLGIGDFLSRTLINGALPEEVANHFLCYGLESHEGFSPREVTVADQFKGTRPFSVLQPIALCNSVTKEVQGEDGNFGEPEEPVNPKNHLLCYAGGVKSRERFPTTQFETNNQFGKDFWEAGRDAGVLCVPSTKEEKTLCGDSVLDEGEENDPPPGPSSSVPLDSQSCRYDLSGIDQWYCNGTCGNWGGNPSGCQQEDADAFCKLKTDNPSSTATNFTVTTAFNAPGVCCPPPTTSPGGLGCTDLGVLSSRGVNLNVSVHETSVLSTHGAGQVITNLVCTNP